MTNKDILKRGVNRICPVDHFGGDHAEGYGGFLVGY